MSPQNMIESKGTHVLIISNGKGANSNDMMMLFALHLQSIQADFFSLI